MHRADRVAVGGLVAFVLWTFVVLPFYYGPRDNSAAQKCSAKESENYDFWEKARCDPIAYFTLWLVGFTGVLAVSTIGLWIVTWRAGVRQSRDTAALLGETRRLGEAQVRAYVHIKSVNVDFLLDAVVPRVAFIASNSGQSPARNFLWNITVQYAASDINRVSAFNPYWLYETGIDIPATSDAPPEAALIPNIAVKQYVPPGTMITVIRLKIEFRFTDVFDKDWFGEAYFAGTMRVTPTTAEGFPAGVGRWQAQVSPIPKPRDWDQVRDMS
jgi:hypothetical protein